MATSEFAIEILNVVKEYKSARRRAPMRAVDDVTIKIKPGEVYGLIGPNGSGKSTTMKMLLGLAVPTAGSCKIFGAPSLTVDSRDEVGFLPENPYFYKHLSGAETLRFYGRLCGMGGKELKRRIDELLEMTGLTEARDRRVGMYSKGMLQRIGLAQALIHDPRLLIFDEPTAGVDPIGSRQIRDLIISLRDQGKTVLLSSHLLEQVQEVCDRIGLIFQGKMICEGELEKLISIEDRTEIIFEGADEALVAQVRTALERTGVKLESIGRPRATLEKIFLRQVRERTGK